MGGCCRKQMVQFETAKIMLDFRITLCNTIFVAEEAQMKFNEIKNGIKVIAVDANYCGYCHVGETYEVSVKIVNGVLKSEIHLKGQRGSTFSALKPFLKGFKLVKE